MKSAKFALVSLFLVALSGSLVAEEVDTNTVSSAAHAVVNINQASAVELAETLTGVGEERAAAIIEYREKYGPFQSVDDLVEVKGIGDAILSENASRIEL